MKKFNDYPRLGSIVGYSTVLSAAEAIKKAGSLDTEKLVAAMSGLQHMTPMGMITYRPQDHQSTMGGLCRQDHAEEWQGHHEGLVLRRWCQVPAFGC
jgi:amino acid/amide ABC transporter substrate-binding protein, HAAT family (TC 3.A.1.4.-)